MADTQSPAPAEKPQDGTCCSCGYAGEEETECLAREDRIHCVHWWEGPLTQREIEAELRNTQAGQRAAQNSTKQEEEKS